MVTPVIDLSVVTGQLLSLLNDEITNFFNVNTTVQQFQITVSGNAPETVRNDGSCQLSLYLLHVSRDPFYRNATVLPDRVTGLSPNTQLPLSLSLSYLLTAFAGNAYQQEQQAMSIALRAFHENAIFKPANTSLEFTIQVEADSIEEMSRFWQAVTVPIRLSALFRVAVVFLAPTTQPPTVEPPPRTIQLAVGSAFNPQVTPQIFQAASRFALANIPAAPPADAVTPVFAPLAFTAGTTVILGGAGLTQVGPQSPPPPPPAPPTTPPPFVLVLQVPVAAPQLPAGWDVSTWIDRSSPSDNELRIALPSTFASANPPPARPPVLAPPGTPAFQGNTPLPGLYQLTTLQVATGATGIPIPFAIAAQITAPSGTTFPASLAGASGVFSFAGAGFVPGQTQVALDAVGLTFQSSGTPAAGSGSFTVTSTQIQFAPPSSLPAGTYFVFVRVNGIDCAPSWFITVGP